LTELTKTPERARNGAHVLRPAQRRLSWVAIGIWVGALVTEVWVAGVPLDRQGVLVWVASGLLAMSIGRRPLWTVAVDWLPFAAVLIIYDYTRGFADSLDMPVLWRQPGDVDRFLFGGTVPTVWLQDHLKLGHATWWEVVVSLTYCSFFLMPYVVAGVLWIRARSEFRKWALRFVTMSFLGVACFILIPTAPPWAAAACRSVDVAHSPANPGCMYFSARYAGSSGLLGAENPVHPGANPWVERLSGRGWVALHLPIAKEMLDEGQGAVDQVAAIPSLHGGCTMLLVIFAWTRVRKRWRPVLVGYALLMAFSLVYSAEHYVVDILAGWLLAVVVSIAFGRLERRRSRSPAVDTLEVQSLTAMESAWPPIETTQSSISLSGVGSSTPRARSTAELDPPGTTVPSASN
jgi:hypothetical protein